MIAVATAPELEAARTDVCELVRDAAESGATIGFLLPVDEAELNAYVDGIVADIATGKRIVLLARDGDRVIGMAQLELAAKANARHRAEVQKVVVHTSARRQGLGRQLMAELEAVALADGRWLLLLDTHRGSAAETLYRTGGWTELGVVPDHALTPTGALSDTTFYFKRLD